MILQTFSNPVWTVEEVGRVWFLLYFVLAFFIWHLCVSLYDAIIDVKKLIIKYFKK